MAQMEGKKLDSGDLFPKIDFNLTDGTKVTLPEKSLETWGVLLVYRGNW
jgi:hypothetical protein